MTGTLPPGFVESGLVVLPGEFITAAVEGIDGAGVGSVPGETGVTE